MDATFSLELSEEVVQVRDWVHEFAETVIRPAAAEWDEREETPWPIIQEAAKVGLYSLDLFAQMAGEAVRPRHARSFEEMFWGDAGIALSIMASGAGRGRGGRQRHAEQIGEWCRRCSAARATRKLGAFCSSEPDAGSDVGAIRTRAKYDEAADEWVLNGAKTWATNGGIANVHVVVASVEPELGTRGQATSSSRPAPRASTRGRSSASTASGPRTPPRSCSTTSASPAALILGGRERLERRLARIREGRPRGEQAAMKTFERTRPASARWPSASPARPTNTRRSTRAARVSSAVRSPNPGHRVQVRRHESRIDAARLLAWRAGLDGAKRQAVRPAEGSMSKLVRGRDRGPGHRAGDPDPRRERLHPGVPRRALAPGRQDLHHLRGHREIQRLASVGR